MIEKLKNMDCGLFKADWETASNLNELSEAWNSFDPEYPKNEYTYDIKIHMLMPGQYPCIPNWHYDMVPRDSNGNQDFSKLSDKKMYLWVSSHPLPEFRNKEATASWLINPKSWVEFTQTDSHRGTISEKHTWRAFIRAVHSSVLPSNPKNKMKRRHSQVYLDSKQFTW